MLSRIHLARNIDVSLVNVMRTDAFADGYVHRWTIPETTIAQVIAGRYEIEHAGGHLFIEPGEMYRVCSILVEGSWQPHGFSVII